MTPSAYQRGWRRMLVDLEVPAWEEQFLAEFDVIAMADSYARARVSSVMFSCKNLSGLCFWPTRIGEMHPAVRDRDVIAKTVAALDERGIASCAYYSVIFDNWAFEHHEDWRIEPVGGRRPAGHESDRYGCCCPNNPGYRKYIDDQIADLYGRYQFGCAFCDMSFWPATCGCEHCRDRYRREAGAEIPDTIDWTSPDWCAFQAARERWIDDFQGLVTDAMRAARPGIAVYHNFALGPMAWPHTVPFSITERSDFLGGDLYGDEIEQLVVMKLMRNLSVSQPVEYMTFATTGVDEHVRLKSRELLRAQVLRATAESAAFMYIDAIDLVGTINPAHYDATREAFAPSIPFEPHLGGRAVEDVAVYFSNESKLDFAENGTPLVEHAGAADGYPHLDALRGACRILQSAHVPFGVITRRQLGALDRHRVLVLPSVARMDVDEVCAVREFARRGGRVYASAFTSVVESSGVLHDDFMLADMFGVHLAGEEPSRIVYVKPVADRSREWVEPQLYLSANPRPGPRGGASLLRLRAQPGAEILATLTLPYAHPHLGDVFDRNWASIHSSPPWQDTDDPVLVEHAFGAGRVVYSAFALEAEDAEASDRTFAAVVESLLAKDRSVMCDAHPRVWLSAFHQAEGTRVVLLNAPPAVVSGATVRLRAPAGVRFTGVEELPSGRAVPFDIGAGGTLEFAVAEVPELTMFLVRHQEAS